MKKIFEKLIAAVLAVVMAFQFQVPTFAAAEKTDYVSDLMIAYGEGEAGESVAKSYLEDNGYTVIDSNLNSGTESGSIFSDKSSVAVYLGYKTTTDEANAITDIRTMNMTGNYSYEAYAELLKQKQDEIDLFMDGFKVTIAEWRYNYNKGKAKAIKAYNLLNLMYDEDKNNALLGDLLLNETVEEMGEEAYNKLSDEEKMKHANMTTILMQGNLNLVIDIEEIIAIGSDTDSGTWVDRYVESPSYDKMLEELEAEAKKAGKAFVQSDAEKELVAKYDTAAGVLAKKITSFQEELKLYKDSGVSLITNTTEEINKYMEKLAEDGTSAHWYTTGLIYEALDNYELEDGTTLLDVFTKTYDSENAEDRKALYSMAASLSEGQRAAVSYISITELLQEGLVTEKEAKSALDDIEEFFSGKDKYSVYYGIDRSAYKDVSSTALTDASVKLQNAAQLNYHTEIDQDTFGVDSYICAITTAAMMTGFVVSGIVTAALSGTKATAARAAAAAAQNIENNINNMIATKAAIVGNYGEAIEIVGKSFYNNQLSVMAGITPWENLTTATKYAYTSSAFKLAQDKAAQGYIIEGLPWMRAYDGPLGYADFVGDNANLFTHTLHELDDAGEEAMAQINRVESEAQQAAGQAAGSASKIAGVVTCVFAVLAIVSGVLTYLSASKDLKAYYNQDFSLYPIPKNMVDRVDDASITTGVAGTDTGAGKNFLFYKAVQSSKNETVVLEDGTTKTTVESYGDLNGGNGKEWLALYYTKDSKAGSPITVSEISGFEVVTGGAATPEGKTALRMFGEESAVNLTSTQWCFNDPNGGTYLYYTVVKGQHAASIFSSVNTTVLIIAGGVLVAVIFFLLGWFFGKRRKNGKTAAEQPA